MAGKQLLKFSPDGQWVMGQRRAQTADGNWHLRGSQIAL